jgi:Leucine-rich repeat (LRR) protein
MPNLHELYLAENLLTEFSDLKDLPQLLILRLRKNQIVELSNIPCI